MVEVLIEEMYRSGYSRQLDYERAVVVDAERQAKRTGPGKGLHGEVRSKNVLQSRHC